MTNPPFRLFIQQNDAISYDEAETHNHIPEKYVLNKLSISSTVEVPKAIKLNSTPGFIASLGVTSLFTKAPLTTSVRVVIHNFYNNEDVAPPPVPHDIISEVPVACAT